MNLSRFERLMSKLPIKDRISLRSTPFILNHNQKIALDLIRKQYEEHRNIRIICCKSRRVGMSSLIDSLLFTHCLARPQAHAQIVAHQMDTSESGLLRVPYDMALAINRKSENFCRVFKRNLEFIHADGDSKLDIATAGTREGSRGKTLSGLHLCLSSDSLIYGSNGNLVPISKISVGDIVVTHGGFQACVKGISYRSADEVSLNGRCIRIRTWLNRETVTVTPDHKVWTKRGWVCAKDLSLSDYIGTHVHDYPATQLQWIIESRNRKGNHGKFTRGGIFRLTKETGFFCGYYLAEGSIVKQHSHAKRPSALDLSRHRDEALFAERAISAVSEFVTSWRHSNAEGKRSRTVAYGASLAGFMKEKFGERDDKRIPDWVFHSPKEFQQGIILGYLAGDGSKSVACHGGYICPTIYATSVRPRLTYQLRHLLASVGWGWGGITKREAYVDSRGWVCREAWTISINGIAASHIRRELQGIDIPESIRRTTACKYSLRDGYVWTKIRELSETKEYSVWDIEVDHPDHSFETVIGAVANSEAAFYPSASSFLSLLPTVADAPDTIIAIESTPNGKSGQGEAFFDQWEKACNKGRTWSGYVPIFLSWLDDPECVRPEEEAEDAPATDLERELMKKPWKASLSQIAWMRRILESKCKGEENMFRQEYGWCADVAFVATGDPAFPEKELRYASATKKDPLWRGYVRRKGDSAEFVPDRTGNLKVWEWPKPQCHYYIGGDAASGYETGDFACLSGFNGTTGKQAFTLTDHIHPEELADCSDLLGRKYNNAMLNIELTGNLGRWAQKLLRDTYIYPNLYIWRGKDDKKVTSKDAGRALGWETTSSTRGLMFDAFRQSLRDGEKNVPGGIEIYDAELISQMYNATFTEGLKWIVKKGHDDVLCAACLAVVARAQYPPPNVLAYRVNIMDKENRGNLGILKPQEELHRSLKKDLRTIFRPQIRPMRSIGNY